jgi:hypothetical protein
LNVAKDNPADDDGNANQLKHLGDLIDEGMDLLGQQLFTPGDSAVRPHTRRPARLVRAR